MAQNFIKNKEDFNCGKCGVFVVGNGYTNHCPDCLWSKHVDVIPGDRAAKCCGMMEPISFEKKGDEESILHKCIVCGYTKMNLLSKDDNYDKVIALVKNVK